MSSAAKDPVTLVLVDRSELELCCLGWSLMREELLAKKRGYSPRYILESAVPTMEDVMFRIALHVPEMVIVCTHEPSSIESRQGKGWEELDWIPPLREQTPTTSILIVASRIPRIQVPTVVTTASHYLHINAGFHALTNAIIGISRGQPHADSQLIPQELLGHSRSIDSAIRRLTPTEWKTLEYMVCGMTSAEIARLRSVSEDTVKTQQKSIRAKLRVIYPDSRNIVQDALDDGIMTRSFRRIERLNEYFVKQSMG
jgi:DNA-binding NarL/FixJ family response regulator